MTGTLARRRTVEPDIKAEGSSIGFVSNVVDRPETKAEERTLTSFEELANEGSVGRTASDGAGDGKDEVDRREIDLLLSRVLMVVSVAELADLLVATLHRRKVDDRED